jgi:cholesterol oxidase
MSSTHDQPTSLQFTEEMKGFITFGETDYQRGHDEGKHNGTAFMFHLTIKIDDIDRFVAEPQHVGRADGFIRCDAMGGQRPVEGGIFNLFVSPKSPSPKDPPDSRLPGDSDGPKRKLMLYRLFFLDGEGNPYTMSGFKDVKDDPGFDPMEIWKDTSTLYTRILRGRVSPDEEDNAEVVASGIIIILRADFAKQLTTFKTEGPNRLAAMAKFNKLFMGSLREVYGPSLKND